MELTNKHKGTPARVVAHGPSLNPYIDEINNTKDIVIGCNLWYSVYKNINYCVFCDTAVLTYPYHKDVFSFIAKSVCLTDSIDIDNVVYFDQRHFNGQKCEHCDTFGCGKYFTGEKTIQEEVQKYTGHHEHYSTGDTVAVHMIAIAILMGCNPIKIYGVDMDYTKGYAKNDGILDKEIPENDIFAPLKSNVSNDIRILTESAKNIGVDIYDYSNRVE
jgi:hypothetical protein